MRCGLILTVAAVLLAGCGDSGSTTQPSAADKLKAAAQDVKDAASEAAAKAEPQLEKAGNAVKDAATMAAEKAEPTLERAGTAVKKEVHEAAGWVAEKTDTQPATMPR